MCEGKCHLFLRFYWNRVQVHEHNFTVINTSYNHLSPAANAIVCFFSRILDTSDALHDGTGQANKCETGGKNQYNEARQSTERKLNINGHLYHLSYAKQLVTHWSSALHHLLTSQVPADIQATKQPVVNSYSQNFIC